MPATGSPLLPWKSKEAGATTAPSPTGFLLASKRCSFGGAELPVRALKARTAVRLRDRGRREDFGRSSVTSCGSGEHVWPRRGISESRASNRKRGKGAIKHSNASEDAAQITGRPTRKAISPRARPPRNAFRPSRQGVVSFPSMRSCFTIKRNAVIGTLKILVVFASAVISLEAQSYRFGRVWDDEKALANAVIVVKAWPVQKCRTVEWAKPST